MRGALSKNMMTRPFAGTTLLSLFQSVVDSKVKPLACATIGNQPFASREKLRCARSAICAYTV
jgi:hypothetical protein